jgi:hypothetical protein
MHINSNALLNLIWRLKPTIDPATRLFLVGLFFSGFISSYFVDPRFKTQPQHAPNPNVENQPAKPAIVFVGTGWDPLKLHFRSGAAFEQPAILR